MAATTAVSSPDRAGFLPAVMAAGAVTGVLDITSAFVHAGTRGTPPAVVLKSVASGLLGRAAYSGGAEVAALGLLLHFVIATGWAGVFYAASRSFPLLVERPFVSGPLYGILVCVVMYYVVIPVSAVPSSLASPTMVSYAIRYGIHILFVGLPIALVISRFARRERPVAYAPWVQARTE